MATKTNFFLAFLLLFGFKGLFAQTDSSYFRSPVDFPIELAGNFCELRNNHFHSGIDIRTGGKEGLAIFAAASGFVSRIKVSPFGYGNALYLDHPNGQTTVYGHLMEFDSSVAAWVKLNQYEKELYELDLFPKKDQFYFEKGQIIALSGNSGGSEGPHLHFEIRNTQSEMPFNPLNFGIEVLDQAAPTIHGILAIPMAPGSKINGKPQPFWVLDNDKKNLQWQKDTLRDTLSMAGKINFELEAWDKETENGNKNGLYAYHLFINDTPVFKCQFEEFSFEQTKYINAHIDYHRKKSIKRTLQRCYKLSSQPLKFYQQLNDSILPIHFKANRLYKVELRAEDMNGQIARKVFFVTGMPSIGSEIPQMLDTLEEAGEKRFVWNKANAIAKKDFVCELPPGALYQNIDFQYQSKCLSGDWLSNMHKVHTEREPLHKAILLKIKLTNYQKANLKKAIIVRLNDKNQAHAAVVATVKNDWVEAKVSSFGNYIVTVDEKKPVLEALNFKNAQPDTAKSVWYFKGTDNLSGIGKYTASIDGQWVLLAYDAKNNLFSCYWREVLIAESKKHDFEIVLFDKTGNKAVLRKEFVY
jgi:hypothetical protein